MTLSKINGERYNWPCEKWFNDVQRYQVRIILFYNCNKYIKLLWFSGNFKEIKSRKITWMINILYGIWPWAD